MAEPRNQVKNNHGCVISVRVIPRSSRVLITSDGPGSYRVKLTAPPVEDEANQQLTKVLSEKLAIPSGNIRIISGGRSRRKQLRIDSLSEESVFRKLSAGE